MSRAASRPSRLSVAMTRPYPSDLLGQEAHYVSSVAESPAGSTRPPAWVLRRCLGGIGRSDEHRHAVLLAEPLREADVVDVVVRQQQRPNIDWGSLPRGSECGESAFQSGPSADHRAASMAETGRQLYADTLFVRLNSGSSNKNHAARWESAGTPGLNWQDLATKEVPLRTRRESNDVSWFRCGTHHEHVTPRA
jgi:hypothetical protein